MSAVAPACFSEAVYTRSSQVGRFLKSKVFAPGRKLGWNELTEFATGEPLNAKAFAKEFR